MADMVVSNQHVTLVAFRFAVLKKDADGCFRVLVTAFKENAGMPQIISGELRASLFLSRSRNPRKVPRWSYPKRVGNIVDGFLFL